MKGIFVHNTRGRCSSRLIATLFLSSSYSTQNIGVLSNSHSKSHDNNDQDERTLLNTVATSIGIDHDNDWYNISPREIKKHGGELLLNRYNQCIWRLLEEIYPERSWQPWRFDSWRYESWQDPKIQRKFMDWVGSKLGVSALDDWYKVNINRVKEMGGRDLLEGYHGNLLYKALVSIYPEHQWYPWLFPFVPRGFWQKLENQRDFLEWFASTYHVSSQEQWYSVQVKHIRDCGGLMMIKQYEDSLCSVLNTLYPEFPPWKPWLFDYPSHGMWESAQTQRMYLEWLAELLNIECPQNWHRVQSIDVQRHYGRSLLEKHDNSIIKLLKAVYPRYSWHPWKFQAVPREFWDDLANQREYMAWLAQELQFTKIEDWYQVTIGHFERAYGKPLIVEKYNESVLALLSSVFPDYPWQPWRFAVTPRKFWDDMKSQLEYIEWLGGQLGVKKLEDWHNVTINQVKNLHGATLLEKYNGSLIRMLRVHYPHHTWQPWKFVKVSQNYWNDYDNIDAYTSWLADQLGVVNVSDALLVTSKEIEDLRGSKALDALGGVLPLLAKCYPHMAEELYRSSAISKAQGILYKAVASIIQTDIGNIWVNYRYT